MNTNKANKRWFIILSTLIGISLFLCILMLIPSARSVTASTLNTSQPRQENTTDTSQQTSTWYVNGSVAESGDGTTPETAFKTIVEGINAARTTGGGDVRVAKGIYFEGGYTLREGENLYGAGIDKTIIDWSNPPSDAIIKTIVLALRGNNTVEGFTIIGRHHSPDYSTELGYGIQHEGHEVTIQNNRIINNGVGIWSVCLTCWSNPLTATITNNIFENNLTAIEGIDFTNPGSFDSPRQTILNNTIVNNEIGIRSYNPESTIENNIIANNDTGIDINYWVHEIAYNNLWGNSMNYPEGAIILGDGSIAADPLFANSNYYLTSDSPSIDAGNPAPEYNDPDGSRNNQGAYGGPYALPLSSLITLSTTYNPALPTGSDIITLTIEVHNAILTAKQVMLTATLPYFTHYVTGSASSSLGTTSHITPSIQFNVGQLPVDTAVTAQLALTLTQGISNPLVIPIPITITWLDNEQIQSQAHTMIIIVNPQIAFLPFIKR